MSSIARGPTHGLVAVGGQVCPLELPHGQGRWLYNDGQAASATVLLARIPVEGTPAPVKACDRP